MEILSRLTQVNSPSSNENEISKIILNEVEKYCDEITTDPLGNLIVRKKGNGKKIMFAAHMDEIGILVKHIDDNGFIRFANVGGLSVKNLPNLKVRFSNGIIGVIGCEEEQFLKKAEISKLFIDIGTSSKAETGEKIQIGDMACFVGDFYKTGNTVISKALDDRVGCYVLIEALKRLKETKNDLYFVFTVQEEVGIRGAKTSAYTINPDFAVAVDVTDTGDTPKAPVMDVKLGGGAAIKVMDRSIMCDSDVRTYMIETSKKNEIPYQLEIMMDGGTDAGAIHLTKAGVKTGGLSIPTRYIHSSSEMANINDINACIDLIEQLSVASWDI